jgi:5-methylcytosine-specific restriction endonuclease McrA
VQSATGEFGLEYSRQDRENIISLLQPSAGDGRYQALFRKIDVGQRTHLILSEKAPIEFRQLSTRLGLPVSVRAKGAKGLVVMLQVKPFSVIELSDEMISIDPFNSHSNLRVAALDIDRDNSRCIFYHHSRYRELARWLNIVPEIHRLSTGDLAGNYIPKSILNVRVSDRAIGMSRRGVSKDDSERLLSINAFDLSSFTYLFEIAALSFVQIKDNAALAALKVALWRSLRSPLPRQTAETPIRTAVTVLARDSFTCSECRDTRNDEGKMPLQLMLRWRVTRGQPLLAEDLRTMCDSCALEVGVQAQQAELDRRSIPPKLRWEVLTRDKFTCRYCGRSRTVDPALILEIDHVIPWAHGGPTTLENLVTACHDCNSGKSDSVLE